MSGLSSRFPQQEIYRRLGLYGSRWLKSHLLFADRQVAVIDKPPGLVCQLGDLGPEEVQEGTQKSMSLDQVFKDIKSLNKNTKPSSVHRLDKPTTGCLLIALNRTIARRLSKQFKHGVIDKTYLAIVRGGEQSFESKSGVIKAPLLYNDGYGEVNSEEGKDAHTEWELIASSTKAPVSVLRLRLITGNKHQLRIHLAKCLKTPILGDDLYCNKPLPPSITEVTRVPPDRLFLHASQISFDKFTEAGKRLRVGVRARNPKDFQRICGNLGITLPYNNRKLYINDRIPEQDEFPELKLWKKD